MNALNICTTSEQMWLRCVDHLNNLSVWNYKTLSVFDSSVRVFRTPLNGGLMDIQIPFKTNGENRVNDTLNERYNLLNSKDAIQKSSGQSNVETETRKVHVPKYFNVKEALDAIKVGLPDDAMPINGGPIIVLQLPTSACDPTKPPENLNLIVIVKSCVYCFEKRLYARDTYMKSHLWKDFRIRFVFVVGLPKPNETDVYHFDGVNVDLHRGASGFSKLYKNSRWIAAKKLYDESRLLFNLYLYVQISSKQDSTVYGNKSLTLCIDDIFTQVVESQSSWLAFIDALNNLHNGNFNQSKTTQISTELFQFTYFSLPINNTTLKLLDFKNHLKVLPEAKNTTYHFNEIYNEKINNNNVSNIGDDKSLSGKHYPKYFNMTEYLNAMSTGFPPNEVPVNNGHLIVIETPRTTCDSCHEKEKLGLVVLIKSCIYCYEQRSYARKTYMNKSLWNNLTVRFVFVVGMPVPNETNIYHFDGVNVQLDGRSWWESKKHELSRWSVIKELRNESRFYGDLLIGGFFDTYFNLTTKMMLSFRWACIFCKNMTPLFLFIDDDYVLHPNNTMKLVKSIKNSEIKSYVAGPLHPTSIVMRPENEAYSSKWAVSLHEYPWNYYPPYFYGIGYMIGADVVCDVSVTMSFTQNLRIDDAYLGIVLARLNKKLNHLKGFNVQTDTNFEASGAVIIQKSKADLLFS
ncbi:unnamed protein product [Schistosoma turkestanicum]|nr:unnamed protein product [Schistosoma turkestanicum]